MVWYVLHLWRRLVSHVPWSSPLWIPTTSHFFSILPEVHPEAEHRALYPEKPQISPCAYMGILNAILSHEEMNSFPIERESNRGTLSYFPPSHLPCPWELREKLYSFIKEYRYESDYASFLRGAFIGVNILLLFHDECFQWQPYGECLCWSNMEAWDWEVSLSIS